MARNKEPSPQISNVAEIDSAIVDDFKKLLQLDTEIAAAIAEHVQPMKDERKEMWSNLAAKVDIPKADIGLFYKLFKRQEDSRTFEDEADGKAVREAHRMLFSALAKGQTLDFIDVLGQVSKKPKREKVFGGDKPATPGTPTADAPAPDTETAPLDDGPAEPEGTADQDPLTSPMFTPHRGAGAAAFGQGKDEEGCPYKAGSQAFVAWMFGFYRAEGYAAYDKGDAVTACRYTTGSPAWKHWNTGWTDAARKDGADAATVMGAGGDVEDVPPHLDRRTKKATTTATGNA